MSGTCGLCQQIVVGPFLVAKGVKLHPICAKQAGYLHQEVELIDFTR